MKTVFIVTPQGGEAEMFRKLGYTVLDKVQDQTLICFCGGSDISPFLYGEEPNGSVGIDEPRDIYEKELFLEYRDYSPMVGICRGAQFLHVMNGGKLEQDHRPKHSGYRRVACFGVEGPEGTARLLEDHHQVMIDEPDHAFVMGSDIEENTNEIIWYPRTRSLCFQAHPEWGDEETFDVFRELLRDLIENPET